MTNDITRATVLAELLALHTDLTHHLPSAAGIVYSRIEAIEKGGALWQSTKSVPEQQKFTAKEFYTVRDHLQALSADALILDGLVNVSAVLTHATPVRDVVELTSVGDDQTIRAIKEIRAYSVSFSLSQAKDLVDQVSNEGKPVHIDVRGPSDGRNLAQALIACGCAAEYKQVR